MKILVVSLLRLGDFIMLIPVLNALRNRYPHADLHLLTHEAETKLAPMMSGVRKWWTLPREALQAGLGEAQVPALTSFHVLRERLDEISAHDHDLVINLTHTQFAGYVCGYLSARERVGLAFDPTDRVSFHSPWFQYLNQNAQVPSRNMFHYLDIYMQACDMKTELRLWQLQTTPRGEAEVQALKLGSERIFVGQVLTSDSKKNWGIERWASLIHETQDLNAHWVVLGAPSEREELERLSRMSPCTVAILSLEGALSLLRRSHVLVTGDTSIKHLANAAATRVVELSLGSSDFVRTGIYKPESWIVQSGVSCAPCPHSAPCSQASQLCAERLSPEAVASVVRAVANGERPQHQSGISCYQTAVLSSGYWYALPQGHLDPKVTIEDWLDRSTWQMWLNQNFKQTVAEYGSESVRMQNELEHHLGSQALKPVLEHLEFLESQVVGAELRPTTTDAAFSSRREQQKRLEQDKAKKEIKRKLIRSLRSRLMESV